MTDILVASAGEDVRLWKTPELNLHAVKNGANANVVHCCCSSNGQLVAYAHEEQGLNVASLTDDSVPVIKIPTPCEQSNVMFNGNSRYLISGGIDNVISIWDIKSRTAKRTYKDHVNPVCYCLFNYNDNVIASASDHGEILITNVQTGVSCEPMTGSDTQAVRCLGYSLFSRHLLASASDSGVINLWDTKEKKMLLKSFTDHKAPATGLSFSPLNDMLLCSTGLDKKIIFYDVTGKKTVKTINTEGPVTCCDFMNDGCTVAAGTASGRLYMFDLRHGSTPLKVIPAHKTSIRSVSFQKIPKENKSPRRPLDEALSQRRENSSVEKTYSGEEATSSTQESYPSMPMKSSSGSNIGSPMLSGREYNVHSMMGGRENSTLALNNVLSQNKTPEMMMANIPSKAARLMGDEIFSPIAIDPSIQTKKTVAYRQKSSGKANSTRPQSVSIDQDEVPRPAFFRSKSGTLSKFSLSTRSTDDLLSTMKKTTKEVELKDDGKKSGLLGFKSPFKKKTHVNYNKHSDESETSSIDSFNMDDKSNTLGARRGKKDRLSDRSNDSGGRPQENVKLSNGSGRLSPHGRQIDTNQLLADIQHSLGTQGENRSPSLHSVDSAGNHGDMFHYGGASNGQPVQFQVDFIHRMIDEAMEENRSAVHNDMVNLQVEMLRQMEIQKEQIRQMMQHYSINDDLVAEIDRLRAENEKLRTKY